MKYGDEFEDKIYFPPNNDKISETPIELRVISRKVVVPPRILKNQAPSWMSVRMIRIINKISKVFGCKPLTIPLSKYKLEVQQKMKIVNADLEKELLSVLEHSDRP